MESIYSFIHLFIYSFPSELLQCGHLLAVVFFSACIRTITRYGQCCCFSPVCLQGSFKSGDKGSRSRPSSFTGDVKPCVADSNESSTSTCSSLTPVSSVSTDSTNTSSSPPEVSPDSSEQSYAAKAKEAESAMAAMDLSSTDCDESATNASSNNVRLVDLDVSELETGDDEEHYVGAEDVPADENEEEYDNYHEVSREQGSGCFAAIVCCCCLLLLFAAAVCCCCLLVYLVTS